MEIVQERLEREFNLDLITTSPNVRYQIYLKTGEQIWVENPSEMPDVGSIESIKEPYIRAEILIPPDFIGPVNIGSEEMISINDFANMAIHVSGKDLAIHNIDGQEFVEKYGHECPIGVNGRNSDNTLYFEKIGWVVSQPLVVGMKKTYDWIYLQNNNSK